MSMTLKRIELWNIRCHEHLLFEPDLEGITSVSGSNGAGKSTIVDAFAWGMYGTKTNNIKNKMLIREGVSTKTDKVQVEIEITINRIDYLVRRAILGDHGGAECNVYGRQAGSGDEFNHLAGPAISSAESFIKQVTKMDEKGFLTSILIQQKQVDQIVAASPRERGAVIEKLTGIQAITNAIGMAREEANALKKAASVITLEDTETLESVINEEIEAGKALRKKTDEDSKKIELMKVDANEKIESYREAERKNQLGKSISQDIAVNKEKLSMQSAEMTNLMSLIDDYRKETKTVVTEDLSEIERNLKNANSLVAKKNSELMIAEQELKSNSITINSIKESLSKVSGDLVVLIGENEEDEVKTNLSIDELNKELYSIKAEENQAKKSMSTLGDGLTSCPVCKSHIEDPEELKAEIEREISLMKERTKEINKELKALKSHLQSLSVTKEELISAQADSESLSSLELTHGNLVSKIEEANEAIKDLSSKANVFDKQYKKAIQVASRVDEVNRAKDRVKLLNNEMKQSKKNVASFVKSLEELSPLTDRELAGLRNSTEKETKSLEKLIIEWNKETERLVYLRARVEDLTKQYDSAVTANEKYTQLTETMKQANVAGSLMSEFKENRMKYSIPALEMYASTILSKFTDGDFIKLTLDSKFNTFVTTSSGTVRPIALLSGGELSAAAIALRIGISMLLNEGESNVLILDEILVSMDKERARHIIETITSITNCQVIFIAHNADIQEIADRTVQI